MELVIFIGIQATGKSTYYKQTYADTHIRLNMDMLKTRNRESILLEACLRAKQSCVVDNTNPERELRARYIEIAKEHRFRVHGLYFASDINSALTRNSRREKGHAIPEVGIKGTLNRLERPNYDEGFDHLEYVQIAEDGSFSVQEWQGDI